MNSPAELIQEAESMEPLPASCARLIGILAQDDWRLDDIVSTIGFDPALTGRLLKLANSAVSAPRHPISSVKDAVSRLGSGSVLTLAMSSSMHAHMAVELPMYGMDEGALWRHSISCALAVEAMRLSGLRPPSEAFVAGLVHDIGKLVVGRRMKGEARTAFASGQSDKEILKEEARVLGIDHAQLGSLVAQFWELPGGIPEAVAFHHDSLELGEGPVRLLADFVAASDAVAHGALEDHEVRLDANLAQRIGADPARLEQARVTTLRLHDEVAKLYR